MADVSVPSIATATPDGDDTVLGVKDGIVKRFTLDNVGAGINFSAVNATTNMVFNTNGTEKMRLDSAGNVGVGISSPLSKLSVNQGADGFEAGITLSRSGADRGTLFLDATNNTFNIGRGSSAVAIDSSNNLIQTVNTTAATLGTNNTLTFSIVDNSTLRISVRGSDGTTRTGTVALT